MSVGGAHAARARARSAAVTAHPGRLTPQPAPRPPQTIPAAPQPPSDADGEWPVDWARARYDAERALEAVDWSKRDLYIWVPGTSNHWIHPSFEAAVRDANQATGASLSRIEYEASWRMRPSVATGVETMRLVLAGIAAHGGNHRVFVAGESQGAWILGEAMSDPRLGGVVTRAVLFGHPSLALHQYTDGHDPRVTVVNNPGDMVAMPIHGNHAAALDALTGLHRAQLSKLPALIGVMLRNPAQAGQLLASVGRWILPLDLWKDPHNYSAQMVEAVEWLQHGRARATPHT